MKWLVREIIYLPKFIFICFLALVFGIFNYKKGLNWLYKKL